MLIRTLIFLAIFGNIYFLISGQIIFPRRSQQIGSSCVTKSGEQGLCMETENCGDGPIAITAPKVCFFRRSKAILCCKRNITTSTIENVCDRNYPVPQGNGTKGEPEFVGGILSQEGARPHMAAIGWKIFFDTIEWNCGGILISYQTALTAAHCTSKQGIAPDIVRVGAVNLTNAVGVVDFDIIEMIVHPDYRPRLFYNDIAILRLKQISDEIWNLEPICLWANWDLADLMLLGMGYGSRSFSEPNSNILFEGNLTVLGNEECNESFEITERLSRGIINSQICAQDPNGADTCQGDSGGPLQFSKEVNGRKRAYLVGITSFGQFCGGLTPSVYTRVSAFSDWIVKVAWDPKP